MIMRQSRTPCKLMAQRCSKTGAPAIDVRVLSTWQGHVARGGVLGEMPTLAYVASLIIIDMVSVRMARVA